MIGDFRLEVFVSVAQSLSFTKSSQALNITQPAVTKHIKELERQLSGALFVRMGSRIALTERGKRLVPYAKNILAQYQKLSNAFADNATSFTGRLRLGASTTLAQYILPSILASFKRKYPDIIVTLTSGNSDDISTALALGKLDFALVEGDDTRPSLHYQRFAEDKIVLLTSAANNKYRASSITLERITTLPFVVRESGSGTLSVIDHALNSVGISLRNLNVMMALGSSESIVRYLLNSDCFAFLSLAAASDYLKDSKLRIVDVEGLKIERIFRFVELHGNNDRIAELFKVFCISYYNH